MRGLEIPDIHEAVRAAADLVRAFHEERPGLERGAMKKLVLLGLALSRAALCNPEPPAQVPQTAPTVAAEVASAAAKVDPDMPGQNGETPPPPPAPPANPFPSVSGTLGGSPWELKGAGTTAQVQADGTVLIALGNYLIDCSVHTPGPGDRTIVLQMPWQKGAKVDLATLKGKELSATAFDEKRKKLGPVKGWKPKGTAEIVAAPTKGNSSGRIKIELTSGGDSITAEVPVKFCFTG